MSSTDPLSADYQPPDDIWEVNRLLRHDEALDVGDQRYVETEPARGDVPTQSLLKTLGYDPRRNQLRIEDKTAYTMLCGHRGCGKSTELRRLGKQVEHANGFFVVLLDVSTTLDHNDLRYADLLLGLAQALIDKLNAAHVAVDPAFFGSLRDWFREHVVTHSNIRELDFELEAGVEARQGLPFLGNLFGRLRNVLRTGSRYRSDLREVVNSNFTEFADSFNRLIQGASTALRERGLARQVLFIVDGTDRLSNADAQRLFIHDVNQLTLIRGSFLYCGPIYLVHEGTQVNQYFTCHVLPMIRIEQKDRVGQPDPLGYEVMRRLVQRRAAAELFDSPEQLDQLIRSSGGNPRELLRLLELAFQFSDTDRFDAAACAKAIERLRADYRRILEPGDYLLLHQVDHGAQQEEPNDERIRFLLYNLALLEYNGYWRRSHPLVRDLPAYLAAG